MKQKNIAVEILRKLLADQVSLYKRTNLVQSQKFSEMITRIMNAYYNGHIDNEKTIEELLEAAKMVVEAYQAGEAAASPSVVRITSSWSLDSSRHREMGRSSPKVLAMSSSVAHSLWGAS